MFTKILCLVVILSGCLGDNGTEDEYVDAVLDMLLNGVSREFEQSGENDKGDEPVLSGGVWKCGACDNIDETKLIYSEVNEVEAEMMTDESVDIQIGISLPNMKCVTVHSDVAGVVRRVSGACSGETVTLSVAPAQHFTLFELGHLPALVQSMVRSEEACEAVTFFCEAVMLAKEEADRVREIET